MVNYKRNITRHIYALWTLVVLSIGALMYSLAIGALWSSVIIMAILLFMGFIPVTALYIEPEIVKVVRYTAYGYKKVTLVISETSGYKGELFLNGDLDQIPDDDHPLSLIVLLIPLL